MGNRSAARAILTGALVGAQTGLAGIPQRFLDGLEDSGKLMGLAAKLAAQVSTGIKISETIRLGESAWAFCIASLLFSASMASSPSSYHE